MKNILTITVIIAALIIPIELNETTVKINITNAPKIFTFKSLSKS